MPDTALTPDRSANLYSARRARRDEIPTLIHMIRAMAMESEGRELAEEILAVSVPRVFDEPALGTYWVMARGEKDTCVACTMTTTEWSDWHNAPYWWLQSVYVHPDHRGRGLMGEMIRALTQEAKQNGAVELRLYVERENQRAIRAYEKVGFDDSHYLVMTRPLM